ncbi:uncharacterized protein CMU_010250 [Cryptosporidium muris RN66]|uniref:Activator of Hsp90 ATPase homologue 1/2-like C-terminal domain-containing protein n=1 Tax=Cryptosporidium muris (strain RN66) TaxID=441375 RepID=B6AE92_CRYMR|nr:uncharacterized protein CMU_010250 [Cryptosporidium muris RN66]EEA06533.1 hypothetical protein, conserved [Cryptosporidium muris RN66]|eukprot:XP_002140882.1 hypothetical protein [Cryptosporidium muris RN66]
MTTISSKAYFRVPPSILYQSMLDERELTRLALGSPCKMDASIGGKFSLYNNYVEGEIEYLEPSRKIVQKWRCNSWKPDVYSKVTIEFLDIIGETDCTEIVLKQTSIPSLDKFGNPGCSDQCLIGWESNFWDRFEKVLGYPRLK